MRTTRSIIQSMIDEYIEPIRYGSVDEKEEEETS